MTTAGRSQTLPEPPTDSRGFPLDAEAGPDVLRKVQRLVAALVDMEREPATTQEGAIFATCTPGGAIAIYYDEGVDNNDPTAGLVGWVQRVDAGAWCFATSKRPTADASDSTAGR